MWIFWSAKCQELTPGLLSVSRPRRGRAPIAILPITTHITTTKVRYFMEAAGLEQRRVRKSNIQIRLNSPVHNNNHTKAGRKELDYPTNYKLFDNNPIIIQPPSTAHRPTRIIILQIKTPPRPEDPNHGQAQLPRCHRSTHRKINRFHSHPRRAHANPTMESSRGHQGGNSK